MHLCMLRFIECTYKDSRKQSVVALWTTEAEYIALSTGTQEALWLRRLLSDIKITPTTPTIIREDNQETTAVARNPISHARTKHIDIKFHYVCETLYDRVIKLVYCSCPTDSRYIVDLNLPNVKLEWECCSSKLTLLLLVSVLN